MTIYLAKLTLTPRRPDVARDLADPYDMHRTLSRAAVRATDDLAPFLWRQETSGPTESPVLLVQSEEPLNWAAIPEGYLESFAQRSWEPESVLTVGHRLRFKVTANPTVTTTPPGHEGPARGNRKRMGLRTEPEQLAWIQRQCNRLGLVDPDAAVLASGVIKTHRKPGHPITVCVAELEGTAVIGDSAALGAGIRTGIGHARMLGLGLFTVAPVYKS